MQITLGNHSSQVDNIESRLAQHRCALRRCLLSARERGASLGVRPPANFREWAAFQLASAFDPRIAEADIAELSSSQRKRIDRELRANARLVQELGMSDQAQLAVRAFCSAIQPLPSFTSNRQTASIVAENWLPG